VRSWRFAFGWCGGLLLVVCAATAETVNLLCVKDTAIYSFSQIIQGVETGYINNSAGAAMGLFAGSSATSTPDSSNVRRALIAFDLSVVPANACIQAVTLSMGMDTTSDTQARPVSLYRLEADWGEGLSGAGGTVGPAGGGGSGSPAEQDDTTWLYRFWDAALGVTNQAQNPLKWNSAGGDHVATPSATTLIGIGRGAVCRYTWEDSTTPDPQHSLWADVEYWLAHPDQNFGWIVIGDEIAPSTARRFQSRENDTTQVGQPTMDVNGVKTGLISFEDFRPYLIISYVLDGDGDGVSDSLDRCPGTVQGSPVDVEGCPPAIPGDLDRNGAVDADDLAPFEACASGPGIPQLEPECLNARLDADEDVDQADFGVLQRCWSGPLPGDPACAN
jgi:hypothetical protein